MEYRALGRTGVEVGSLCLGAMMFGAWGNTDHEECCRIIQGTLDAGINFIDTADVYSAGESEEIVGDFLGSIGQRRQDIVLATKVHGIEADLLQVCREHGMGVLSWSPLAGGWLSGRYGTGQENKSRRAERMPARYDLSLPANAAKLAAVDQLSELAAKAGHSLPELAVAFVLAHPAVTSAIIGPRTMEQLISLLDAANILLDHDVLDAIDQIVPPGQDLNIGDHGWVAPWVEEAALRRRY